MKDASRVEVTCQKTDVFKEIFYVGFGCTVKAVDRYLELTLPANKMLPIKVHVCWYHAVSY